MNRLSLHIKQRLSAWSHFVILFAAMLSLGTLSGCQQEKIQFTEVKRINENLTREEIIQFLKVVRALPGQKLPELPPLFAPLPHWDADRTLTVSGLVAEEQEKIHNAWQEKRLAKKFRENNSLVRALKRHRMTPEQFAGLTQTIGIAYNRSRLREKQDLKGILRKGRLVVHAMETDERTFAKLSDDVQYELMTRAGWITRIDRATRLLQVPESNTTVAKAMEETFAKIFPEDFSENPLDNVVNRLHKYGIPFEELPEVGNDQDITWNPSKKTARIGHAMTKYIIVDEKTTAPQ